MTAPIETITSIRDLRPGDIGLGPIGGLAGLGVTLGQWVLGEGLYLGNDYRMSIRHACIVTDAAGPASPGSSTWVEPQYVEAMPSGARAIRGDRWNRDWAWCRLPEDYPGQAADAAAVAMMMADAKIPYSPVSYLYLARWRLGLDTKRTLAWINRRQEPPTWTLPSGRGLLTRLPREAICSVLVDQSWTLAGKRIMHGVPHQCVTPKGLANTLRFATEGVTWAFPGR